MGRTVTLIGKGTSSNREGDLPGHRNPFPPEAPSCTHRPRAEQAACCQAPPGHRHPHTSRSPHRSGTGRPCRQERHATQTALLGPRATTQLSLPLLSSLPSFHSFKLGRHGVEGVSDTEPKLAFSCPAHPRDSSAVHPRPSRLPGLRRTPAPPCGCHLESAAGAKASALVAQGWAKQPVKSRPAESRASGVGYTRRHTRVAWDAWRLR